MQSRNPFQPPRAPVGSGPAQAPRPRAIEHAFRLMIGTALLGLANFTISGMGDSPVPMACEFACQAGIAFLLRAGQNWARIVFAVLFVLLLSLLALLVGPLGVRLDLSTAAIAIMALQFAFQGFALWLVFSAPGRSWFEHDHDAPA